MAESRRAERELLSTETGPVERDAVRAEQILRAHADNSPLAVIEFDPETRVVGWAASAERMFGYTAEEVLGSKMDELHWVYEEDLDRVRREFSELIEQRKPRGTGMSRHYRKDGSLIWCECYLSALHDREGRLVSILSLVLDITERKRAEERAREELENTRTLLDTAAALASARSLNDVLDALCDAVLRTLPHTRVTVSLWHEDERAIETATSKGQEAVAACEKIRFEDLTEPGRRMIERRESAIVDYDRVSPGPAARMGRVPSHLALGVPLVSGDRLVGLLTIDDPRARLEFCERDVEIAEGIASQASVAIENALLLEDERERTRLAEALAAVDLAIHGSLEWQEIAERALKESSAAIGARTGAILGHEGAEWVVWHAYGFPPSAADARFAEDRGLRHFIEASGGRTVALDDALVDAEHVSGFLARYGVKSLIAAPLVVRGETVAVLVLAYRESRHHFTPNEVHFLSQVASALSLALANARLYTGERDVSDSLQEAMLTLPDRLEGVDFAHAYHSAAEVARVGGDFCDLFEMEHDLVGVMVGDVAGKGLAASMLTSLVKNVVRAHASEKGAMPAAILALTNDFLYRSTASESFVTVFLGVLDRSSGRFVYANAGHTTGAVLHPVGSLDKLEATGPILGAFHDVTFRQSETRLDLDDLLFLYTDGLTESRRDHELFGEGRVFALLAKLKDGPSELVRGVIDEVLRFTGGRLSDDLAVLALRRVEAEGQGPRTEDLTV